MKTTETTETQVKGNSAYTGEYVVDDGASLASDNAALAALGYKQEFKRSFNAIEVFGLGFSIIGLFPSIAYAACLIHRVDIQLTTNHHRSVLVFAIPYGGPVALVWGVC